MLLCFLGQTKFTGGNEVSFFLGRLMQSYVVNSNSWEHLTGGCPMTCIVDIPLLLQSVVVFHTIRKMNVAYLKSHELFLLYNKQNNATSVLERGGDNKSSGTKYAR